MAVTAIIQARMGATRLPGKIVLRILQKTVLEYVVERVNKAEKIQNVVIATTVKNDDLKIVHLASGLGVGVYCGSEEDVLDRYYQAARLFKAKHIARITADCPLIDHQVIDAVVKRYFESGADYCSNTLQPSFPDGLDVEVFNFEALHKAWENAQLLSEREHVTPYLTKNSNKFNLVNYKNREDLSDKRWTLDEERDYRFIKEILGGLYDKNPDFNMTDILDFLRKNKAVEDINKNIGRNEGYQKSLTNDKSFK
ncbi:cytidylyltransferase domain-containing protein [Fibrobacterota bacterium]